LNAASNVSIDQAHIAESISYSLRIADLAVNRKGSFMGFERTLDVACHLVDKADAPKLIRHAEPIAEGAEKLASFFMSVKGALNRLLKNSIYDAR
jgi:hypothetical protein